MRKAITIPLVASALSLFSVCASADTLIQIWSCELNDGKTRAEAVDVSSAWLQAAKGMEGGDNLVVLLRFPVAAEAGDDSFRFVMVNESASSWGNWVDNAFASDALSDVNTAWNDVAYCTGSSLWNAVNIE